MEHQDAASPYPPQRIELVTGDGLRRLNTYNEKRRRPGSRDCFDEGLRHTGDENDGTDRQMLELVESSALVQPIVGWRARLTRLTPVACKPHSPSCSTTRSSVLGAFPSQ